MRVITATLFAACVASLAANAEAQDAQQGATVAYTIAASDSAGSPTRSDGAFYPNVTIHNYSPWGLQVWVHYTLNSCDTKWLPVSISRRDAAGTFIPGGMAAAAKYNSGENACLISSITVQADGAPKEVQVTNYQSTGTSYREFYFLPAPPEVELGTVQTQKYWQLYSASEAHVPNQGKTGMSPGFVITNKTKWPLAVTLDQVGCLYRDLLRPGDSMNRTTGAVWFTITAENIANGNDPNTTLSCAIPVVEVVADVLEAALTAGAFSWAGLSAAAVAESVGPVGALAIPGSVVRSATTAAGKAILTSQTDNIMSLLRPNQKLTKAGQYAGPPWPFRCSQKPTYEITGGWGRTGHTSHGAGVGDEYWIDLGTPLKITKTNTCGDSMMK